MTIRMEEDCIYLEGIISVEEAEPLLAWLIEHPDGAVDLTQCEHLHTSSLQLLLATDRDLRFHPDNDTIGPWLGRS